MPPIRRPFPRFIADSPQEQDPYGRWGERLTAELVKACEPLAAEAGAPLDPETVRWFPERGWGGRVFVPAAARTETSDGSPLEYFGYVSFERQPEGEPTNLAANADFTDVTAGENPDWRIDLNEEVIGSWRSDAGRGGDVTLVWGSPLVRGAVAATAELEGEAVDQVGVVDGRFTLIAVDAVRGFGDEIYLEVKLWDKRLRELASESLYEEAEGTDEDAEPDAEGAGA
jgi:hypothetical protein